VHAANQLQMFTQVCFSLVLISESLNRARLNSYSLSPTPYFAISTVPHLHLLVINMFCTFIIIIIIHWGCLTWFFSVEPRLASPRLASPQPSALTQLVSAIHHFKLFCRRIGWTWWNVIHQPCFPTDGRSRIKLLQKLSAHQARYSCLCMLRCLLLVKVQFKTMD
jgi:hypothetical protein